MEERNIQNSSATPSVDILACVWVIGEHPLGRLNLRKDLALVE